MAILTYHKFDGVGNTQAYNARWEGDGWKITQTSDRDYRWWFEGGGSIVNDVLLEQVELTPDGRLALDLAHSRWCRPLDSGGGHPASHRDPAAHCSPARWHLMQPESDFPEMRVRLWADDGRSPDPAVRYLLRWATLPANRDRPRTGPLPEASALRLMGDELTRNWPELEDNQTLR